jgi:hypothetical protein
VQKNGNNLYNENNYGNKLFGISEIRFEIRKFYDEYIGNNLIMEHGGMSHNRTVHASDLKALGLHSARSAQTTSSCLTRARGGTGQPRLKPAGGICERGRIGRDRCPFWQFTV